MSKKLKLAAGFIGLATIASTIAPAMADSGYHGRHHGMRDGAPRAGMEQRFKDADADSDGTISFEEFAAAMEGPLANADADGNGSITVEEAVAAIKKRQEERLERRAERLISRFDTDKDGSLSVEEAAASRERVFARLDRDNDGRLEASEMRRGHHRGPGGKFHRRGGNDQMKSAPRDGDAPRGNEPAPDAQQPVDPSTTEGQAQ
ncbi:EF-hand domain-containing protein [Notoacmeibacter ruber]|uniref:Acid-shock protein n=1 Tax=Notoacmeibacter ruber TaxID=2670375 RepID=A0A3L7JD88_9HYPH|nr:EF-hand domain-containing protein [Notoacmeibacter ruber]RLQ87541.1 acid-shock protein [Notoacmeibacter ruber]